MRPVLRGLAALGCAALVAACAPDGPIVHGKAVDVPALEAAAAPVSKLGEAPERRPVTASGHISQVCQSMGCWFYLADDHDMVYIDLEHGSRFTIPKDSRGQRCLVAGTLAADGGDRRIIADTVVLWPK